MKAVLTQCTWWLKNTGRTSDLAMFKRKVDGAAFSGVVDWLGDPMWMRILVTDARVGVSLRASLAAGCMFLAGCGTQTGHGSRTEKVASQRSSALNESHYSVLGRPGANGISVIDPSQVAAARSKASRPIWVRLPPAHGPGAARPEIASARELTRAGKLRTWLAKNSGGGICILAFDPDNSPDPRHDHSLLVFCGSRRSADEGAVVMEPGPHGTYLVAGAVPDGVRAVDIRLVNGEHRHVLAEHNSYHTVVRARLAGVTFAARPLTPQG